MLGYKAWCQVCEVRDKDMIKMVPHFTTLLTRRPCLFRHLTNINQTNFLGPNSKTCQFKNLNGRIRRHHWSISLIPKELRNTSSWHPLTLDLYSGAWALILCCSSKHLRISNGFTMGWNHMWITSLFDQTLLIWRTDTSNQVGLGNTINSLSKSPKMLKNLRT